MVSPIYEEIFDDRIKSRVNASKIDDEQTLVDQIRTLPKTKSVTKYNQKLNKYTTFTVDFSPQKEHLVKHADVMIQSSTSLQKIITDNVTGKIKNANIKDFTKIKIDKNLDGGRASTL